MTKRALIPAALALAAVAIPAPAGAASVATHEASQSPESVLDHWTAERMRNAEPLDPPDDASLPSAAAPTASAASQPPDLEIDPARDALYPERIHGKLFVTLGARNASCSGTVVTSRLANLVLTAGHCVVQPGEGGIEPVWATNVLFVPAYRNGAAPYGGYPAVSLRAPLRWVREPLISLDVGAVSLVPGPSGVQIQEQLGARGVAFNRTSRKYRGSGFQIFGYPGEPAAFYDAERPVFCNARFQGIQPFSGSVLAGPCNMKQGSSGGGFVDGGGLLNSVVSHGNCLPGTALTCTSIAGTFFGPTAFKLWSSAGGGIAKGKRKQLKACKRKRGDKRANCRMRVLRFPPVVR